LRRSGWRRSWCLDVLVLGGDLPQPDTERAQAGAGGAPIRRSNDARAAPATRKVHVEAAGSLAILRGTVRPWDEHEDAERAAWSVPDVTAVRNELEIVVQELAEV
jgi:hypothetical protein